MKSVIFLLFIVSCHTVIGNNNNDIVKNDSKNKNQNNPSYSNDNKCDNIISNLMEYLKEGSCIVQKEEKDEFICNEKCLELCNAILRKFDKCYFEKSTERLFPTTSKEYLCSLYKNSCNDRNENGNKDIEARSKQEIDKNYTINIKNICNN